MGKYDEVSSDYLYNLFITQNLSKPEISKITGIPCTSLDKLLTRRGIVKSPELLKEMQSRLMNTVYANRTEEARLRKIAKLKKIWDDKSEEQRQADIDKLKAVNANRTPEHRRKLIESNRRFYENESEEHRKERIEKNRLARINYNEIETEEHKKIRYAKRKVTVANWSEEKRKQVSENHKKGFAKRTQEQISESYKKAMETRKKRGSLFVSNFEKEVKAFVESLGFCTSKKIAGYANNRFEIDILVKEKAVGIECNGIYYHSCNGVNKYPKDYHMKKRKLCKELGITPLFIWEDLWIQKKSAVENIIRKALGVYEKVLRLDDIEIKAINDEGYKSFCKVYCVNDFQPVQVKLGLFYENNLIGITGFVEVKTGEWELVDVCSSSRFFSPYAMNKLFACFLSTYCPKKVHCVVDCDLFADENLLHCGFNQMKDFGPKVFYIKNINSARMVNKPSEKQKFFICYNSGLLELVWTK